MVYYKVGGICMQANLEEIKQKAIPVLKKAGVIRSSLFGSFVRGEQNENSDIDILVEMPDGKSLFDFVDLQLKLEDVLGRKVDLGEYETIKPRLKNYISNSQIQIL